MYDESGTFHFMLPMIVWDVPQSMENHILASANCLGSLKMPRVIKWWYPTRPLGK